MGKYLIILLWIGILAQGCGQGRDGGSGSYVSTTILASDVFNVSGAKAIATASSNTVSTKSLRASSVSVTELIKLNASGEISSVFGSNFKSTSHPPISVIEIGPDKSLYVGFEWGVHVKTGTSTTEPYTEKDVAFFRIKPDGTVEIVDDSIYGVGTWYGDSNNGELPVKQVQFDSSGNIYYIGRSSGSATVLKKKTTGGIISQIGSSNMAVRDFLVAGNGMVFFHGSNAGNWSIEWLRVINNNTVNNIFYNDGNSGWLRAYYYDNNNHVFLVGENLTLLDQDQKQKKYSGIIRVSLDSTGKPATVEALYDDNNMYSETYTTIGDQLNWGYWDPSEMTNKKFFATDDYNNVRLPLSLEAGVTEQEIRSFIRNKYQKITSDNLESIAFTGLTTLESWNVSKLLNDVVTANITGKTWAKWRQENGLTGIRFGNAKQLAFTDSGLYAVMKLDNWGSGSSKGDKLFKIVNSYGSAEISAFPQDSSYKSMSRVRAYTDPNSKKEYAIYLSNKVGMYKIFRLDLTNSSSDPVDMTQDKTNVEIFSFNYNADTGGLFYDVYDLNSNTSYLAQQQITSSVATSIISAEGYTITDVVPFEATK